MGKATHGQSSLWFYNRLEIDGAMYNSGASIRLDGEVNPIALRWSLDAMIARHESLCTCYAEEAGALTTRIVDAYAMPLTIVHCETWTAEEVQQDIFDHNVVQFDLGRGPTVRATLHHLSQGCALTIYLPHIISDFISLELLVDDLLSMYGYFSGGHPPAAQPPVVDGDFGEHAAWLAAQLDGPRGRRMWAHWRQKLSSPPALLDLPTDRPRGHRTRFRSSTRFFAIPAGLTEGLRRLGETCNTRFPRLLFSAFAALLYRYSGQARFNVGFTGSTRARPADRRILGYMINMMVLEADCGRNPSFLELAGRINTELGTAIRNSLYPFSLIVDQLKPERSLFGAPFYRVSFNMLKAIQLPTMDMMDAAYLGPEGLQRTIERDGLTVGTIQQGLMRPALDELVLTTLDRGDILRCCFSYDSDLYDAATIDNLSESFVALLAAITDAPETPIDALTLTSPEQRRRVTEEWNDTAAYYPSNLCFHDLVAAVAQAVPEAPAVISEADTRSFDQLDRAANQLARRLLAAGLVRGDIVAVCMHKRPALIEAFLGILKAGGVYLPIDPACPPARLTYIIEDAAARLLLLDPDTASVCPSADVETLVMDAAFDQERRACDHGAVGALATPDDDAYVIYTSGSTGKPKGVAVRHRGLVNLAWDQRSRFQCGPGARVLQFASIGFDASVWEMAMALGAGAAVCQAPPGSLLPGTALASTLEARRITHVTLPPSALGATTPGHLPDLRVVVSAGEPCTRAIAERWHGPAQLFNAYGPTETTVCATIHRFQPGALKTGAEVPIGRPLANLRAYVLDGETLQPLPPGVAGELFVAGPAVARGYLNRPELSGERFIEDPFAASAGARLYRTGDIVRRRADGAIAFIGRRDDQVKIRGHRIELGEIQAALASLGAVSHAAAVCRQRPDGERFIAAYVTPRGEARPTASELLAGLREQLPAYMMPESIQVLDALPITANGKVDKDALPEPSTARPALATAYEQPLTEMEQLICGVWKRILDVDAIGVNDSFFDIGGQSISLLRAQDELCRLTGREIAPVALFKHPTIASLAAHLEQATEAPTPPVASARADLRARRLKSMARQQQSRTAVRQ